MIPSINVIIYKASLYSTTQDQNSLTGTYRSIVSQKFLFHRASYPSLQKETSGIPLIDSVAMHAPRPRRWHTVFAFGRNTTLMALTCSQRQYRAGNSRLSASPRLASHPSAAGICTIGTRSFVARFNGNWLPGPGRTTIKRRPHLCATERDTEIHEFMGRVASRYGYKFSH